MAAATAPRDGQKKAAELMLYQIGAVQVWKEALAFVRADGYAYPARAVASNTDIFIGVFYESINNSAGAAGAQSAKVYKNGSFVFAHTGLVQANVGSPAYASDDQTITATPGSTVKQIGYIAEILSATQVRVRIDNSVN